MFADFIAYYAAHIADRSRPFPGLDAALDRLAGARLPLRGLHQQARRAVAAPARRARPDPRVSPRSAARTPSASRSPIPRSCAGPSRPPAATAGAVMVGDSGTDIATARAAGIPVVAVDFGYSETPVAELGPDRLISHFDELPQRCWSCAAASLAGRRCPMSAKMPRFKPSFTVIGANVRGVLFPAGMPRSAGSRRGTLRGYCRSRAVPTDVQLRAGL